ncbi:hypothetical protein [Trichlorobacter sp.]|uniref:hypothetical protein n=1 Tax=Trichlorobacter sp. TaxID=2911007 RepID=UPI002A36834A|nr:hypothetical protein [Trichlorobacter sp.]MDY0384845.1 hypothetical protein [Trichlorobacter sp.]
MSEQGALMVREFANGLKLELVDTSRHYFGGYWRLSIEARCLVPLSAATIDDPERLAELRRQLGDPVPLVRSVEQMAVPPELVDETRAALQQRLLTQLEPLLEHPDFAARFIAKEYQQRIKRTLRGIPCLS